MRYFPWTYEQMFAYVTLALMVVGSFYFPESINTRTEAYKLLFYFVFKEEKIVNRFYDIDNIFRVLVALYFP